MERRKKRRKRLWWATKAHSLSLWATVEWFAFTKNRDSNNNNQKISTSIQFPGNNRILFHFSFTSRSSSFIQTRFEGLEIKVVGHVFFFLGLGDRLMNGVSVSCGSNWKVSRHPSCVCTLFFLFLRNKKGKEKNCYWFSFFVFSSLASAWACSSWPPKRTHTKNGRIEKQQSEKAFLIWPLV